MESFDILMIFSTLYHELVCQVEHFSVELDTLHKHVTKELQMTELSAENKSLTRVKMLWNELELVYILLVVPECPGVY